MDDESLEQLLPTNRNRKNDIENSTREKALFFGVVLGFVFSLLFAFSGILPDDDKINVSKTSLMHKSSNGTEVSEIENLADYLRHEVRVLCMVMTTPEAVTDRGFIIMDTWGKRCNKLLFFSEKEDANFTNVIGSSETDNYLRLRQAFKFIYSNHFNEFDWILKTNDNSFIVVENLRHLLYQYESDWPLMIGQRFLKEDYMIGDYVLSKRAFNRLLEDAFTNQEICDQASSEPDIAIAKCLDHVNVMKVDGVDSDGRGRFFDNKPESALFPNKYNDYNQWYWTKLKQGIGNCCSDRLIAMQNYYNLDLYYLEYFIYKVHTFGRQRNPEPLPQKLSLEEIVRKNH